MQSINRIVVLALLGMFLVGNIGLVIHTHSCVIDGTARSFFNSSTDPCRDEHSQNDGEKTCCELEEENHSGCCTTDTKYVQLDFDLTNYKEQLTVPITLFFPCDVLINYYFLPQTVMRDKLDATYFVHPPPKFQGRNFQSLIQVYTL